MGHLPRSLDSLNAVTNCRFGEEGENLTPLSFTYGNGNIAAVLNRTIDGVSTTSVYVFPVWIVVAVIAAILIQIWLVRKRRDSSG